MTDYEFFKSVGLCPQCGKRKPSPNRALCAECLERKSKYMRLKKEIYNERLRERRKQQRRERVEAGIEKGTCLYCEKPAEDGYRFCAEHLEAARKKAENMKNGKRGDRDE